MRYFAGWLLSSGIALLIGIVNATSTVHDLARSNSRIAAWEPWVWELTSVAFWIAVLPLLWRVARELRPPRLAWPATATAYVALTVPVCTVHLAWLAALRPAIYAMLGSHYQPDWSMTQLVYEYRKDLLVTLMLIGVGVAVDLWATSRARPAPPMPTPVYRLEVRDGARTQWFTAGEIERVEAAGNYVEVHTTRGLILYRATLTAVETELLDHGFIRVHRSRLVRRDAVTAVVATPSGDFEVRLASGTVVGGSRRFRSNLASVPDQRHDAR